MTRREVASFLRDYWWQLGAIALLVIGWVTQVQAASIESKPLTG